MSKIPESPPSGLRALTDIEALPAVSEEAASNSPAIAPLALTPLPPPVAVQAQENTQSGAQSGAQAEAEAPSEPEAEADLKDNDISLSTPARLSRDQLLRASLHKADFLAGSQIELLNAAKVMVMPESASLFIPAEPLSPEAEDKLRAEERHRQQQAQRRQRHERTRQQINKASEKSAEASRKAASETIKKQAMPVRIESHSELVRSVLIESDIKVVIEPHPDVRSAAESLERYMPFVAVVNAITAIDLYIGTRVAEFQR